MNISIRKRTFMFTIIIILIANLVTLGIVTKYYSTFFEKWQIAGVQKEVDRFFELEEDKRGSINDFNSLLFSRYGARVQMYNNENTEEYSNSEEYKLYYETNDQKLIITVTNNRIDLIISSFSQFSVYIFAIMLLVSAILAYIYAYIITKPILEINKKAHDFSELDFSEPIVVNDKSEIGELSISLNTMASKLKETIENLEFEIEEKIKEDRIKTEFIANVSHDLKTPLSVISCHMDLLEGSNENLENSEYVSIIKSEVTKTNNMLNRMLDLLRYEEASEKLNVVEFDLSGLIEDILLIFDPMIKEKGLKVEQSGDFSKFKGDIEKMERLFLNLISNAVKYSLENTLVNIEMSRTNESVQIKQTNECETIKKPEKLIRRFYQGDNSRQTEGTGLGLSIIDAILRLHNSKLEIKSLEKGLEFSFKIEQNIDEEKTKNLTVKSI